MKKIKTPEDDMMQFSTPEENQTEVWIKKTKTNSFSPLGNFYRGGIYKVPFETWKELDRCEECILIEEQK